MYTIALASASQLMDAQRAQAVVAQIGALPIEVDRHSIARSELLALALRLQKAGVTKSPGRRRPRRAISP